MSVCIYPCCMRASRPAGFCEHSCGADWWESCEKTRHIHIIVVFLVCTRNISMSHIHFLLFIWILLYSFFRSLRILLRASYCNTTYLLQGPRIHCSSATNKIIPQKSAFVDCFYRFLRIFVEYLCLGGKIMPHMLHSSHELSYMWKFWKVFRTYIFYDKIWILLRHLNVPKIV